MDIEIQLSIWRCCDGTFRGYDVHADIPGQSFGQEFSTLEEVARQVLLGVAIVKISPNYEIQLDSGPLPSIHNGNGCLYGYRSEMPGEQVRERLVSLLNNHRLIQEAESRAEHMRE